MRRISAIITVLFYLGLIEVAISEQATKKENIIMDELLSAVCSNDIDKARTILDKLPAGMINFTFHDSVTLLHVASALNHEEMVQELINRGADINARTAEGFTSLHWAAMKKAEKTTAILLKNGADPDANNLHGVTPLHCAAIRNATNIINHLLEAGANPKAETDSGNTPLDFAIMHNANNSAILLASKTASTETNIATVESTEIPAPPVDASLRVSTMEETKNARPQIVPRAIAGLNFVLPLGMEETIIMVWIPPMKIWVGKYEITNGQYRRFNRKHNSKFYSTYSLNETDQPAVYVNWNEAIMFCRWLNTEFSDRLPTGYEIRLPTVEEWITIAKCGDNRKFPWGNQLPPLYGNIADVTYKRNLGGRNGIKNYDDGYAVTCPVTESGSNEWGVYGLAGNVWEWCQDWYDPTHKYKVRLGASWDTDNPEQMEIGWRGFDKTESRDATIGFRIVAAKNQ